MLVSLDSNARAPIAITPLQVTASSVKAVLPPALKLWAYSVRVCAGANHAECSNALPVNVADVWWLAGDAGGTGGGSVTSAAPDPIHEIAMFFHQCLP